MVIARPEGREERRTPVALAQRVVKLALPDPVEEALTLVAVVHQNSSRRVADDPHQHPLTGLARLADEGDLDRAIPLPRALPAQRGDVDAEGLDGRLTGHGTPPP